jgi:hypothetical protein
VALASRRPHVEPCRAHGEMTKMTVASIELRPDSLVVNRSEVERVRGIDKLQHKVLRVL